MRDGRASSALEGKRRARHHRLVSIDWHVTGLAVGQVAHRMQIAPSAVRWYADQGLLPHERVTGNQRRFFSDVLCRVAMIKAAQQVGLSLGEIRTALEALPAGKPPSPHDWERLAAQLRTVLTHRIDELFALLEAMTPAHPSTPTATDEDATCPSSTDRP